MGQASALYRALHKILKLIINPLIFQRTLPRKAALCAVRNVGDEFDHASIRPRNTRPFGRRGLQQQAAEEENALRSAMVVRVIIASIIWFKIQI